MLQDISVAIARRGGCYNPRLPLTYTWQRPTPYRQEVFIVLCTELLIHLFAEKNQCCVPACIVACMVAYSSGS
jgi:hypothetical protein